MQPQIDYTTFELGLATPKLRDDLRFALHQTARGQWYVVEDEANSKFYRIGHAEYAFVSMLDGKTTLQSAIAATAAELKMEAFSETEAAALCKWLIDSDLLEKARTDRERFENAQQRRDLAKRMQWLNPIMLKLPLGNPDRFFGRLTQWTGWMVSRPVGIVWAVVILISLTYLASATEALFSRNSPIISRNNWIWLGIVWLGLRVVHESAHAVTCKRYGGTVREWGVLLMMFIPLPYVDVTSSWRFTDRTQRILTSAAGMMAEVFVAAIAGILWYHADPGLLQQNALNIIFAAGVTTLLFNANPLMRFDGYHMLSDILEAPNLWTQGRAYVRGVGRKFFLGLRASDPPWAAGQERLVKTYGVLSLCWTVLIFTSLSLSALNLLDGFGLLMAVVAIGLWLGIPLVRLVKFMVNGSPTEQPNRPHFATRVGGLAAVAALVLWFAPAPSVVSAPVVIENDPTTIVRNKTPGFVSFIAVTPGQQVQPGDTICILENADLRAQLREASTQLKQSELRMREHRADGAPAAMQYEQESFIDHERRVQELEGMVGELTITAPVAGEILSADFDSLMGTYATPGTAVAIVGDTQAHKATALISQTEARSLPEGTQQLAARVRLTGAFRGTLTGQVRRISPRAQTRLPHFSFAAAAGGALDVIASPDVDATSSPDDAWLLARPHVEVDILLEPGSVTLLSGQTGVVHLRSRNESLGAYLYRGIANHIRSQVQRTHGL